MNLTHSVQTHPMSDSPPNKRVEEMPIDRLSWLPDHILLHILSFLGVKKAATTSVLSKRWEFMWAQLPSLVLLERSKTTAKIQEFVSAINRTLRVRGRIHLEGFVVYVYYNNSIAPDVDFWVDCVIQNRANIFVLRLMRSRDDDLPKDEDLYMLPGKMYSNSSFTLMELKGCLMDTSRIVEWKSLTRLELVHTKMSQHVIETILSGSPILHTMFLDHCWGFNRLNVNSQCLYHLKVIDNVRAENGPLLEISAPFVQKLNILFYPQGRCLKLRRMKSLLEFDIDFFGDWFSNHEEVMDTTKEIYERIQHVDYIHLGSHYFKFISELVVNGWKMSISKRSILTIDTFNENELGVAGVFAMLESSPKLEEFCIRGFNPQTETGNQVANRDLNCDLLHLNYVEIREHAKSNPGSELMLPIAEALLKRTPVLEELGISLNIRDASDHDKVVQRLLACPSPSEKAVIRVRR